MNSKITVSSLLKSQLTMCVRTSVKCAEDSSRLVYISRGIIITTCVRRTTGGNVFSLFTPRGSPFPSHNNSTGLMSFLGVPRLHPIILLLSHVLSRRYQSDWTPVPGMGVPQSQGLPQSQVGGYSSPRWGYPLARSGWGTPPGQVMMGYPQPARSGWGTPLGYDMLELVMLRFPAGGLSCDHVFIYRRVSDNETLKTSYVRP